MRRTVLIVPGLLSGQDSDSFLRQSLPSLSVLSEIGELRKISRIPRSATPEAMLLGMGPDLVSLNQGPLTVSAFGFDPPERSTHFHVSLMSFTDGIGSLPGLLPLPEDLVVLLDAAKRLNTKLLTFLAGEGLDHSLVWEALGDLGTTSAIEVNGNEIGQHLPEGDGDFALRRFIDDSINLLSSLELNERRIDEGLPPFNLLWPWGHGVRTRVPNLALRRGEPATVESASMRLSGLTRLAGYRHGDRAAFGRGLQTRLRAIAERATNRDLTVIYIDGPSELRLRNMPEELEWFVRELDRELLKPLLDDHLKAPSKLCLLAPEPISPIAATNMPPSGIGLAITAQTDVRSNSIYPFDERSIEERVVPTNDLWTLVEGAVARTSDD